MGRLDGRVALVTGAAHERGIGRGIVRELAAEGASVAVVDVAHEEMGEALAAEVGGRFYRADVSDRGQVDELVERVESDLGPLDVVASNAESRTGSRSQRSRTSRSTGSSRST